MKNLLCGVFGGEMSREGEKSMDQSFMKTKKVVPLVASMALPMALSMLVNALYNIVDSFFIAQISEKAMTALSLIFPLQNVTTAVGVGLGVGTNAAVAFFLGGERKQEAQRAASEIRKACMNLS